MKNSFANKPDDLLVIFLVVLCDYLILRYGTPSYNASIVLGVKYPLDTVVTFSCDYGYSLVGARTRKCQTSGQWSGYHPTCYQSNGNYVLFVQL